MQACKVCSCEPAPSVSGKWETHNSFDEVYIPNFAKTYTNLQVQINEGEEEPGLSRTSAEVPRPEKACRRLTFPHSKAWNTPQLENFARLVPRQGLIV